MEENKGLNLKVNIRESFHNRAHNKIELCRELQKVTPKKDSHTQRIARLFALLAHSNNKKREIKEQKMS